MPGAISWASARRVIASADHRLDVGVAQHGEGAPQGGGQLGRHPVGVLRYGEPGAEAAADADGAQPLAHDGLGEEVLPDELAQRDAELVLLLRDDRGVRDGDAQRVAEEGGDREPVGERADHAGLGGGRHIARPGARAPVRGPLGQDVDHGDEEQQTGGGELHPAHAAALGLVGRAERRHRAIADRTRFGTPGTTGTPRALRQFRCRAFHPLHRSLIGASHIVPS
ncbi:hypothetical protein RKD29_002808 [Streptomyces tendae]